MTTSRLVVALAALAVGFAVTLIGVSVADDPTELVVSSATTEPAASGTPSTDDATGTSARVEADDDAAVDPAAEGSADAGDGDGDAAESPATTDSESTDAAGGDGTSEVSGTDAASEADDSEPTGEQFPCSDETLERFTVELSTQEKVARSSETDLFLRVIAQRFAALGRDSADTWEALLDREFDEFVTAECGDDDEQILSGAGTAAYFCVSANLSADIRLFELFRQVAPALMVGCSYEREQGEK